ncbi:nuclear transport factor 2 family protein [Streptomyces sp. NPDC058583]|uniref:nuclear transport factor 2 family protein n=1 Tax=unclassified Streptomyces TaxID=2593676 RepID=UPI003647D27F
MDFKRWDDLHELFTEDVASEWFGVHRIAGREQVVGFIRHLVGKVGGTHHMISNFRVSFTQGAARAGVRVRAYHEGAGNKAGLFEESLAAFDVEAVRTEGGWRFSRFSEALFVMLGTQEVFGLENPA